MVTTNVIKWDDTNNKLTAFCSDDTGETEIGPCKWDDTNNRLEINCNSVDATVKWDDGGNNLESRTTDDGCCGTTCEGYSPPATISVTFSAALTNCASPINCGEGECECEAYLEGTWILPVTDATGPSWAWGDTDTDVCPDFDTGPPWHECAGEAMSLCVLVSLSCTNDIFTLRVSAGWLEQGGDANECFQSAFNVVISVCPGSDPIVNNNRSCFDDNPWEAISGTATVSGLC